VTTDEIKLLFEYHYWANRRILSVSARMNPEQYAAPAGMGTSRGGLRATLLHFLDSDWQWRLTFSGFYSAHLSDEEYRATELKESEFPDLAALQKRWTVEEQWMRAYLVALTDERLNGVLRYTAESGAVRERVLWHCLFHVVDHGTHHRSEAATLLSGYGQPPGDFDFTLFLNEHFHLAP